MCLYLTSIKLRFDINVVPPPLKHRCLFAHKIICPGDWLDMFEASSVLYG